MGFSGERDSKDRMGKKLITAAELKKHATPEDLWLLIDKKVYNVTKYQDEHPGSDSILHDVAGIDASQEFADVGHSADAITTRDGLIEGDFDMDTIDELPGGAAGGGGGGSSEGGSGLMMAIPVLVLIVVLAIVFKVIPMGAQ